MSEIAIDPGTTPVESPPETSPIGEGDAPPTSAELIERYAEQAAEIQTPAHEPDPFAGPEFDARVEARTQELTQQAERELVEWLAPHLEANPDLAQTLAAAMAPEPSSVQATVRAHEEALGLFRQEFPDLDDATLHRTVELSKEWALKLGGDGPFTDQDSAVITSLAANQARQEAEDQQAEAVGNQRIAAEFGVYDRVLGRGSLDVSLAAAIAEDEYPGLLDRLGDEHKAQREAIRRGYEQAVGDDRPLTSRQIALVHGARAQMIRAETAPAVPMTREQAAASVTKLPPALRTRDLVGRFTSSAHAIHVAAGRRRP